MWKAPIEIFQTQMQMQMEGEIMKAVHGFGINVDKDELLKLLQNNREAYEKGYDAGFNANKWIPCSERLPEEEEGEFYPTMYITDKYGVLRVGYYRVIDKQWYVHNEIEEIDEMVGDDYVIAWMPLPEPYREEVG